MRNEKIFINACFVLSFLFAAGCADDEEAIPQPRSEVDIVRDPDLTSARLVDTDVPEPPETRVLNAAAATGYRFDRRKARDYVERFARSPNANLAYCGQWEREGAKFVKIPADCTNFASQVLWYAGLPMQYASAEDGWWYTKSCADAGSSKSWRQVNRLLSYLVTESNVGEFRQRARDLKVGDLIFYRLRREEEGYRCDGNLFNHTAVVSGFDARGEPLVSYHSNDALDVSWDTNNGSRKSLGEACVTAFVHIKD